MSEIQAQQATDLVAGDNASAHDYLTIHLADQIFGIPVLQIQDVLREIEVTCVPLAPVEVAGALNLRGRIVTAINMRRRLNMPEQEEDKGSLSVVVEHNAELYSLIIDRVGDVLTIPDTDVEANPATLDSRLKDISTGIHRMDEKLMVILDVSKFLQTVHE